MLIRFSDSDPRAGQVVRMDSRRGQELVDSGAAVKVKEGGAEPTAVPDTSRPVHGDVHPPEDAAVEPVAAVAAKPPRRNRTGR